MSTNKNTNFLVEIYGTSYHYSDVEDMMHLKAFDILVGEVIDSRFWPSLLPDPKVIVPATLQRLKNRILLRDEFWILPEDAEQNK